jgi:hypothetical protein
VKQKKNLKNVHHKRTGNGNMAQTTKGTVTNMKHADIADILRPLKVGIIIITELFLCYYQT